MSFIVNHLSKFVLKKLYLRITFRGTMKKIFQSMFMMAALLMAGSSEAQTVARLGIGQGTTKCLSVSVEAGGSLTWDSCAILAWSYSAAGSTSTTTVAKGKFVTITFPKTGTYNLCVHLVNTCKKFDTTVCKTFTVTSCDCDLTADFSWTSDCKKLKFLAKSNHTGTTYTWTYGDGNSGKGVDGSHTYLADGVYKICMTATWIDSTGKTCTSTVCKEVKVSCGTPCNLTGDFSINNGKNGEVKLNATSNSGYAYYWDFGDGSTGTGADPLHKYAKSGVYTICLTIVDKAGKCKTTICKKVEVASPCNLIGNYTFKKVNDSTFAFLASSSLSGTNVTYSWTWGDGTTSTGRDARHIFKKAGTYVVCLKITSKITKCYIMECKKITVGASATKKCTWTTAPGVGFTNKCNSYFFEMTNFPDSCMVYQLTLYNMKTGLATPLPAGRTATYTINDTGKYAIIGKYSNKCTGCDTQVYKVFTVDCKPTPAKCSWSTAKVYWSNKCNVYTFELANLGTSACYKYQMSISGNGTTTKLPAGRLLTYEILKTGTYTLCATFRDSCKACDTTVCVTFTNDCQPCSAKASFVIDSVASNGRMYVRNTSTGAKTYYWSFGDSTFSKDKTPSHTYSASGAYTVCLTAYDSLAKCSTQYCLTTKVLKTRARLNTGSTQNSNTNIYPNPAHDGFTLNVGQNVECSYRIVSMTGAVVAMGKASGVSTWIDASRWSSGAYQIQLNKADGSIEYQSVVIAHP